MSTDTILSRLNNLFNQTPRLEYSQENWNRGKPFVYVEKNISYFCSPKENVRIYSLSETVILELLLLFEGREYKLGSLVVNAEDSKKLLQLGPYGFVILGIFRRDIRELRIRIETEFRTKFLNLFSSPLSGMETDEERLRKIIRLSFLFLGITNLYAHDDLHLPCEKFFDEEYISHSLILLLAGKETIFRKNGFVPYLRGCKKYACDTNKCENIRCNEKEEEYDFYPEFQRWVTDLQQRNVLYEPIELQNNFQRIFRKGTFLIPLGTLANDYMNGEEYVNCKSLSKTVQNALSSENDQLMLNLYQKYLLWIKNRNENNS